jgi:PAS domain S-box-containing protein
MQLTPPPQHFIRNIQHEFPQERVLRPLHLSIVLTVLITVTSLTAALVSAANGYYLVTGISVLATAISAFTALQLYRWRPSLVTLHDTSEERNKLLEASAVFANDSMDYLNTILTSMAGSVIVFGTDKKIKFVNQAILDLTGYKASELLGQPVDLIFDPETFSSSRDILGSNGFVRHGERLYKTKSGSAVDVSFSSAVMRDQHKRVTGIVCVAQNISALKKMETELNQRVKQLAILAQIDQELTLMLSVSRVLSIGLDISIRLSGANAGGIALKTESGLTPGLSLGYPANAPEYNYINDGVIRRVARTLEPELILDIELDGDYLGILSSTVSMMLLPLISQDQLIGILYLETNSEERFTREMFDFLRLVSSRIAAAINNAQLYDTSRHQLDELQQVYKQLSALEQLKTDMIRIAAHDLRNPLTNIAISMHVLRKSLDELITPQQRERLSDIEISTRRMQQITSNILSLERINKAATGELKTIVNINDLIQHAFDVHRPEARRKNQRYQLLMLDTDLYIQGDRVELEEAAANFINNAIKYTPENGKITVKLYTAHDMVHFEVRDNGYGIPDDQQSRLFQPFFRAEMKETQEIEGTGLGLHLIKQIIERHYGTVTFQSRYGEGSTFGFQLPAAEASVEFDLTEGDTAIPNPEGRTADGGRIDPTMSGEFQRYSAESADVIEDSPPRVLRDRPPQSRRSDHDRDFTVGSEG